MYQIIFFDIDGTLRDEAYGIPETTKTAIKMCKEKGIYVCLCTGRNIGAIQKDVFDLGMDGIIAGGGSHIEFYDKIIRKSFFTESTMKSVRSYLKDKNDNTAFTFETDDTVFMNKEAMNIFKHLNNEKFKALGDQDKKLIEANEKIVYEENFFSFDEKLNRVNKICLWSDDKIFEEIKKYFIEDTMQLAQSFGFDSRTYYEIIQSQCNKGEAIVHLCEYLKIPLNKTMAFGDGKNDIDMLKVAGLSIGMKNGNEEIFKHVSSICEETMKHGVYLELKRRNVI